MQILNTSTYEKLKIKPVNVVDMKIEHLCEWVDPKRINLYDLKAGDICRTYEKATEYNPNVWVVFEPDDMNRLFGKRYRHVCGGFVRPREEGYASYNLMESYYNTWPKYKTVCGFDIVDVWKTDYDISHISSAYDLVDFYKEHNLFDLCKY